MRFIYLDNASTSYPKPACMMQGMEEYLKDIGVSPYRGSSLASFRAGQMVHQLRSKLAEHLGTVQNEHICFTYNATYAINLLLKGYLKQGDHVILSSFDHNAVLRPLHDLKRRGIIDYDVWTCSPLGYFDLSHLKALIRSNTSLFFMSTHSNVLGMPLPYVKVAELAKQHRIPFGLDCTQALGHEKLQLDALDIAMAAGTGHKGLLGPPGIGFLFVRDPHLVDCLIQGGGGFLSEELDHPAFAPAKYEAGTLNFLGLAGLLESLKWIDTHSFTPYQQMIEGLQSLPIQIYGQFKGEGQLPLFAFNVNGLPPSEVEARLEKQGILVRSGLHCAPLIHSALGTLPLGSVRVSLSPINTPNDISQFLVALKAIISS